MNKTYLMYAGIAAVVLFILYIFSRGSSSGGSSDAGAIAVDVEYSPTGDAGASIAARASAFGELVGLSSQAIGESSAIEQSRMANETAQQISRDDLELGRFTLDVGRQIEEMRARQAMDLMRFQAGQVNYLAESFRNKDIARQSNVLNALVSLWGGGGTGYPYPQSTGGATGILNAIGGIVRGAAGFFNPFAGAS